MEATKDEAPVFASEIIHVRRKFTREERREVFKKTRGKCAYCGAYITIKNFQVDHVRAISRKGGTNELKNLLPACRSCNHFKSTMDLETFREAVQRWPEVLRRDSVTYRNAVRFGLVTPAPKKVVFYFEKMGIKVG